jgi:hypothetical protein
MRKNEEHLLLAEMTLVCEERRRLSLGGQLSCGLLLLLLLKSLLRFLWLLFLFPSVQIIEATIIIREHVNTLWDEDCRRGTHLEITERVVASRCILLLLRLLATTQRRKITGGKIRITDGERLLLLGVSPRVC